MHTFSDEVFIGKLEAGMIVSEMFNGLFAKKFKDISEQDKPFIQRVLIDNVWMRVER
jgi:hypothetical protein